MMWLRLCTSCLVLTFLFACESSRKEQDLTPKQKNPEPSATSEVKSIDADRHQSDCRPSGLHVVGGQEDATHHLSAVKLSIKRKNLNSIICTGSFISDRLLLTAAHCLDKAESVMATITFNNISMIPSSWITHPLYVDNGAETEKVRDIYKDIGILVFAPASIPATLQARFSPKSASVNDTVTWVGYGYHTEKREGIGIRRMGSHAISDIDEAHGDLIILNNDRNTAAGYQNSMIGQGDSGAALFNANQQIVGIAIAVDYTGEEGAVSYVANIHERTTQEFLKETFRKYPPLTQSSQQRSDDCGS
jgi:V8-like Glu-specific endopeptidase